MQPHFLKVLNMLSDKKIKEKLNSEFSSAKVFVFDCIDSTNLFAKREFATEKENPLIVVANAQTAGRGRMGRSFYSPKDTGIYMSIAISTKQISNLLSVTAKTAVGVCRALESLNLSPRIKWVNDVYINNKKVCGILTEGIVNKSNNTIDGIVIGIGVNVSTVNFPNDIEDIAASLGINEDRNVIIASIVNNVLGIILDDTDVFIKEYREKSIVIGKEITCFSATDSFSATAVDVDDNGSLIVKLSDGTFKTISTGEVSIRF